MVPSTVPESTVRSPMRVLVLIASGATEITGNSASTSLSSFKAWIASTSFNVRFDLLKWLVEVSSVRMSLISSFESLGRTIMRLPPIASTCDLMRLLMLPMRLRIKMMLATPIAMPRQVRKVRPRRSFKEVLARSKCVLKSKDIIFSPFRLILQLMGVL